jgi:class 3 adenylate cyclase
MIPETEYTQSGGVNIAYQVFGDGPVDIVIVAGWFANIETAWEVTRVARFLRDLSSFARVITFDKRGTGMSDRDGQAYALEDRMDDVRAVMDAVGSESAVLCGWRKISAPDYPAGVPAEGYAQMVKMFESDFAKAMEVGPRAPSAASDTQFQRQWSKWMRQSASPGTAIKYAQMNGEIDVRAVLPSVRVPALVIHAIGDNTVNIENGRYLAEHLPDAKLVEIEEIERFVAGERRDVALDRVVCTVMFTDIVDSTLLASRMGDQRWSAVLKDHHDAVRSCLAEYRGTEMKTTGDGFHAIFDGPARGVRCAAAIQSAVAPLGLTVRAGLHTGECVVTEQDVEGVAVHLAARISSIANPGAVAVSQTVRDLVVGSGLSFSDLGTHEFKGIPEPWHAYELIL